MAKMVNLTPHPVTLIHELGSVTYPPSGMEARLATAKRAVGWLTVELDHPDDVSLVIPVRVPLNQVTLGRIENLPDPEEGVYYIVSLPVAQVAVRSDVVSPDDYVRDEKGQIIGCRAFATA